MTAVLLRRRTSHQTRATRPTTTAALPTPIPAPAPEERPEEGFDAFVGVLDSTETAIDEAITDVAVSDVMLGVEEAELVDTTDVVYVTSQ
jgi:hypothetical protein